MSIVPAKAEFGVEERAARRQKSTENIQGRVKNLIAEYLPGMIRESPNTHDYDNGVVKLITELEHLYPRVADLRVARNYITQWVSEGNQVGRWALPVPEPMIRIARDKPYRDLRWFARVRELNHCHQCWLRKLSEGHAVNSSDKDRLLVVLMASAIHGGLCQPEAMGALAKRVQQGGRVFQVAGERIWIDLFYDSQVQALNHDEEGRPVTIKRWFPDPISRGLILQFLSNFTVEANQVKELLPASEVWSALRSWMRSQSGDVMQSLTTFNQFCSASVGVAETQPGVELSQVLVEYAVGRVPSSSLPPENYQKVMVGQEYEAVSCDYLDFSSIVVDRTSAKDTVLTHGGNYTALIKSIRKALALVDAAGKKTSKARAAKALNAILAGEDLPTNIGLLVSWLHSLLTNDKLAVSSVSTYFSAIGKYWLVATVGLDWQELDAEGFESLYEDILDGVTGDKKRCYKSARLRQLHRHGMALYGFPSVAIRPGSEIRGLRPRVRAGYISEPLFAALLETVDRLQHCDGMTRESIQCLLILCYRLGLRRGEVLKLTLGDIEDSSECWVFVRNNRFGNNKSSSSLRKLPLSVLLTFGERRVFEAYLEKRRGDVNKKRKALLFSQSASPYLPLNANNLSQLIAFLLLSISGDRYVFHHLRHSTLSRLYLVLSCEDHEQGVMGYGADKIASIREKFSAGGKEYHDKNIFWAIAGVAGHATPETSFSSYIHYCDQMLGDRLNRATPDFSTEKWRRITGFSGNKITRILYKKEGGQSIDEAISTEIDKQLLAYSNVHKKEKVSPKEVQKTSKGRRVKVGVDLCYRILKAVEDRTPIIELSSRYGIDKAEIERWVRNAECLSSIQTKKQKSRLISSRRVSVPLGRFLVPAIPAYNSELRQAQKAVDNLRKIYPEDKADVGWCVTYYFTHTNTSKSGIQFTNDEDLNRFLGVFLKVIKAGSWKLKKISSDNDSQVEYISVDDYYRMKNHSNKSSKYHLLLEHQDKKGAVEGFYSSSAMRYFVYLIGVMIGVGLPM